MSMHARVLGVVAAALALAVPFLAAPGSRADEKTSRDGILKVAEALEKGTDAKKLAEALKKEELGDVMNLMKARKSGGFGVGNKPGEIVPDHIELKVIYLGKKTTEAEIKKQGDAIAEAAFRTAAIAEVAALKCPVDKKMGDKDPKDWAKWSAGMKESALELAKAAKAKDAKKVQEAAVKLNNNCQHCHGVFRD